MAKVLLSCLLLALASDTIAVEQYGIGNGIAFDCIRENSSETVMLVLEAQSTLLSSMVSNQRASEILTYLETNMCYNELLRSNENPFTSVQDRCKVNTRAGETYVPVTVYSLPNVDFAVAMIHPESDIFPKVFNSVAMSYRINTVNTIELIVGDRPTRGQFCVADQNQMNPKILDTPGQWTTQLDSISYLRRMSLVELTSDSPITARISTSTSGLVLPYDVYDAFFSVLQKGIKFRSDGDKVYIQSCHFNGKVTNNELWWLVLTLSGQDGYGIKLEPAMYLEPINGSSDCLLKVSRGSELILGDSFFRSGYVEFLPDRKMIVCPIFQYHASDPAFDLGIPASKRPLPRGASYHATVPILPKDAESNTKESIILIPVLVGGLVLVIAVIGIFVYRARCKRKQPTGDDPSRAMQDPSVQSDTSSVVRV